MLENHYNFLPNRNQSLLVLEKSSWLPPSISDHRRTSVCLLQMFSWPISAFTVASFWFSVRNFCDDFLALVKCFYAWFLSDWYSLWFLFWRGQYNHLHQLVYVGDVTDCWRCWLCWLSTGSWLVKMSVEETKSASSSVTGSSFSSSRFQEKLALNPDLCPFFYLFWYEP